MWQNSQKSFSPLASKYKVRNVYFLLRYKNALQLFKVAYILPVLKSF